MSPALTALAAITALSETRESADMATVAGMVHEVVAVQRQFLQSYVDDLVAAREKKIELARQAAVLMPDEKALKRLQSYRAMLEILEKMKSLAVPAQ